MLGDHVVENLVGAHSFTVQGLIPNLYNTPHQQTGREYCVLRCDHTQDLRELGLQAQHRPRQSSVVWQKPTPAWRDKLVRTVEQRGSNHSVRIFFRADDIGAGGQAFETLCQIFRFHQVPLAMSVVPAWVSSVRQQQLFAAAPLEEPLWGWHQHGWRHVNWQSSGKKSEFGDQRPFEKQWRDIWQGWQKMQILFQGLCLPVFTPPWNRLSLTTIKVLQKLDFKAVSITKPLPSGLKTPLGLANFRIQLDLHTRKAKDSAADYDKLLSELANLMERREPSGIVIHHHRMNTFAFDFLHELLHLLKRREDVELLGFQEILEMENES